MIDTQTQQPIRVMTDGIIKPYIMVPDSRLPEIQASLDRLAIRYWVSSNRISIANGPFTAFINLSRVQDAPQVQAILDEM